MKNKLIPLILLFIILLYSCKEAKKGIQKFLTHKEMADSVRVKDSNSLITYKLQSLNKLSDLNFENLLVKKDSLEAFNNLIHGFYGEDKYHIEFYWKSIVRDSTDKSKFNVEGKTRFKNNILIFSGFIKIDSIFSFIDPTVNFDVIDYKGQNNNKTLQLLELRGKMELLELSSLKNSGKFKGNFNMDIVINSKKEIDLWFYSPKTIVSGGGYKSSGYWESNQSQIKKPYVFGKDIFMFGNDILKDFNFGERDVEINPKYLSLGWQNYWENDEWYD